MNCRFVGSFYRYDQLPNDTLPQIAFAGRSNVGKSTLLNKLTGHKRLAKVSSTPGKTRSINFYSVNDEFYFVDLPGYGYARVSRTERARWGRLLEQYLESANRLIGLIVLLDGRREINERDRELLEWMGHKELPGIAIVTKADKLNRDKINRKVKEIESDFGLPAVPFSALTGAGKNQIQGAIFDLVRQIN
ncbi:MAG: YihA family ribosome biogenesis GTP-binding protein [Candidatus Zixiibacteriota bacterium]|nr:MAG: YihA family ribosome biogenesis GTP-binding protein [candidate division Zixibacteria bacterium]